MHYLMVCTSYLDFFNKKSLYENNSVASGDINLYSFLGR